MVEEEVGKILSMAYRLRQQADYDTIPLFDIKAVNDLIRDVENFLHAVELLINTT